MVSALAFSGFTGCETVKSWFNSSQGSAAVADLEQYIVSQAVGYFNGTLTVQQIIDNAKAKFAQFSLAQIIAIIDAKFADPAVFASATRQAPQRLMTKRPLTLPEKEDIKQAAFSFGVTFVKSGSQDNLAHTKALLARRTGYKYRVVVSKVKPITDTAFDEGAASTGQ
jgi:hypothetical protein